MSSMHLHASDGLTAVVRLNGSRLQLVRHPVDGRVVGFDDADAAFAFAVSLEIAGGKSAGTVAAPDGQPIHMLSRGVSAADLTMPIEVAA
jgi:hypothetical protein